VSRATGALINLPALRHNLRRARTLAPGSRVMAMVKANAYGHGLALAARALSEADAFGVASLDEALVIRHAGLAHPIVLLEGVFSAAELEEAARCGCELVVHDERQLALLEASRLDHAFGAWLKLDTGMHRLGFAPRRNARCLGTAACRRRGARTGAAHDPFGARDEPGNADTRGQLQIFAAATAGLRAERSLANSAALLAWPESHADWVRPGILLYGVSPFAGQRGADHGLMPVMTMRTELIAVKTVARGDRVGYGGQWTADKDTRIGIAAIGYGDGYPRHAPNGTPVLVNDARAPLVGRVSMDMIAVDLCMQPDARVGDTVVLWGPELPVEEIARAAGTIAYELLCGVTQRVKFSAVDGNAAPISLDASVKSQRIGMP